MKGILIPADDTQTIHFVEIPLDKEGPLNSTRNQLDAMYAAIGADIVDITACSLTRYYDVKLIVGDMSRLDGSPLNKRASVLYRPGLFGDVLALRDEGEFLNGWPNDEAENVLEVVRRAVLAW